MTGFSSDEEFDIFAKEFESFFKESAELVNSFENILNRHPLFMMERKKEDFFYELKKVSEVDACWSPDSALIFIDSFIRQIDYYSRATDGQFPLRIKRAAFYNPENRPHFIALCKSCDPMLERALALKGSVEIWREERGP